MGKGPLNSNTTKGLEAPFARPFYWGLLFVWISISGSVLSDVPPPPPNPEKDIMISSKFLDGHAVLSCVVKDLGRRRIIWSRLSDPYPIAVGTLRFHPDDKYKVSNEANTNVLTIKKFGLEDTGEYQCLVSGTFPLKEVISLNIQSDRGTTYFLPTNRTMISALGMTITLPCEVDNLNDKMVLWKDGRNNVVSLRKRIYNGDPRMHVLHDTRPEWHLKIEDLEENDFGFYTCVVNSDPVLTRTVELINNEPPKIAPVIKRDTNFRKKVEVMAGESVTLSCNFHAYPPPTVKWYKRYIENNRTRKQDLHASGNQYTLRSVRADQSGDYVCIANNGMDREGKARTRLIVRVPPTTVPTTVATTVFVPTGPSSPYIYYQSPKYGSRRGRNVELECFSSGQPRPNVHWKRHGHRIVNDHKYKVKNISSGRYMLNSTLLVRSVATRDFGTYECVGYNQLGLKTIRIDMFETK